MQSDNTRTDNSYIDSERFASYNGNCVVVHLSNAAFEVYSKESSAQMDNASSGSFNISRSGSLVLKFSSDGTRVARSCSRGMGNCSSGQEPEPGKLNVE